VARHSGLAEVAEGLEAEYPAELRHLTAFESGDSSDLRRKLSELLTLDAPHQAELRDCARRAAVEKWSWASVAGRLLALGAK